jgi:hypothetical protein
VLTLYLDDKNRQKSVHLSLGEAITGNGDLPHL